jgi:hypothetical protein
MSRFLVATLAMLSLSLLSVTLSGRATGASTKALEVAATVVHFGAKTGIAVAQIKEVSTGVGTARVIELSLHQVPAGKRSASADLQTVSIYGAGQGAGCAELQPETLVHELDLSGFDLSTDFRGADHRHLG